MSGLSSVILVLVICHVMPAWNVTQAERKPIQVFIRSAFSESEEAKVNPPSLSTSDSKPRLSESDEVNDLHHDIPVYTADNKSLAPSDLQMLTNGRTQRLEEKLYAEHDAYTNPKKTTFSENKDRKQLATHPRRLKPVKNSSNPKVGYEIVYEYYVVDEYVDF